VTKQTRRRLAAILALAAPAPAHRAIFRCVHHPPRRRADACFCCPTRHTQTRRCQHARLHAQRRSPPEAFLLRCACFFAGPAHAVARAALAALAWRLAPSLGNLTAAPPAHPRFGRPSNHPAVADREPQPSELPSELPSEREGLLPACTSPFGTRRGGLAAPIPAAPSPANTLPQRRQRPSSSGHRPASSQPSGANHHGQRPTSVSTLHSMTFASPGQPLRVSLTQISQYEAARANHRWPARSVRRPRSLNRRIDASTSPVPSGQWPSRAHPTSRWPRCPLSCCCVRPAPATLPANRHPVVSGQRPATLARPRPALILRTLANAAPLSSPESVAVSPFPSSKPPAPRREARLSQLGLFLILACVSPAPSRSASPPRPLSPLLSRSLLAVYALVANTARVHLGLVLDLVLQSRRAQL
jgi:hypothetical protein